MYHSIEEICLEFGIKYTEDTESIIKQLTKKQAELHPDNSNDGEELDKETFTRITEAKEFLRSYNPENKMITISEKELKSIITGIVSQERDIQTGREDFNTAYNKSYKRIERSFLPPKITLASIMAVITFVWALPSTVTDNPAFQYLFGKNHEGLFYAAFSIIWLALMAVLIVFLAFTFRQERNIKAVLNQIKKEDFQYDVLSNYIRYQSYGKDPDSIIIVDKRDFEKHLRNEILNWDRYRSLINKKYFKKKIPNHSIVYIEELIPQLSDTIINTALEKGLIEKSSELSWSEKYIVKDLNAFDDYFY